MIQKIIDTHIHIWDFSKAKYEWLNGDTSILNRTYSINELEEERVQAGIDSGILVQAANNFEDTNWMLDVAASTDWIAGVVGWLPLLQPDETEKYLTGKYLKNKYFKGVRHLIHDEPDSRWLLQEKVIESLGILARYDVPFDIVGINNIHIETALKVAEKVPGLRMVFDHLNQPPILTKEKYGYWGELMSEAARNPNFYMKISGLGTASKNYQGWTIEELEPYIEFVIKNFGSKRCFCGGDWPVSLLAGSYTKTWQAYQTIISKILNEEDQQKVFQKNAEQFYKLS